MYFWKLPLQENCLPFARLHSGTGKWSELEPTRRHFLIGNLQSKNKKAGANETTAMRAYEYHFQNSFVKPARAVHRAWMG